MIPKDDDAPDLIYVDVGEDEDDEDGQLRGAALPERLRQRHTAYAHWQARAFRVRVLRNRVQMAARVRRDSW